MRPIAAPSLLRRLSGRLLVRTRKKELAEFNAEEKDLLDFIAKWGAKAAKATKDAATSERVAPAGRQLAAGRRPEDFR